MKSVYIFIGGFLGANIRYLVSNLEVGTLLVNILGCFFLSFVLTYCTSKIREEYILLLGTGFMGAFTTFSTFSLETIQFIHDGQIIFAIGYVMLSIGLGLLAAYIGYYSSKKLLDCRSETC